MSEQITVEFQPREVAGLTLKLFMLGTHYTKPINFTRKGSSEAGKTWRRWISRIEPTDEKPPDEFIDALSDDLNTPLAIAHMHRYYKKREGKKLYASMLFLGLLPVEH